VIGVRYEEEEVLGDRFEVIGIGEIKGFEDLEVWQIGKILSGLIHSLENLIPKTYKTEVIKYGKNNKLE